jgi:hypothetical protein
MLYKIKIKGELDKSWSEYFGNIPISFEEDEAGAVITILAMDVTDQSELFGVLNYIQDLNLPLISVAKDEQEKDKSITRKSSL